jgi:hypothetical protein
MDEFQNVELKLKASRPLVKIIDKDKISNFVWKRIPKNLDTGRKQKLKFIIRNNQPPDDDRKEQRRSK